MKFNLSSKMTHLPVKSFVSHHKSSTYKKIINYAAQVMKDAEVLFVTSGVGMSVDSGLPDFRGDHGVMKLLKKVDKNLDYKDIINPRYFETHPEKFWYIYGDRYNRYKNTKPHKGYLQLKDICEDHMKG